MSVTRVVPAVAEPLSRVGESLAGVPDGALPALLEVLGRVGEAIVALFGPDTEVVVHDLRNPARSIVSVSGTLTGRQVGSPVSDPELLPGAVDRFRHDDLCRPTTTLSGRPLTSSTIWVRDQAGHVAAAMCLNVDLGGLSAAVEFISRRLVSQTAQPDAQRGQPITTFARSVVDLIRLTVRETVDQSPLPRHKLRLADRVELARKLDQAGIFGVRGSVELLADELGVSRATVYNLLKRARETEPGGETKAARPMTPVLNPVLSPGARR